MLPAISARASIFINDAEFDAPDGAICTRGQPLNSMTSVSRVKRDFLETLESLGQVHRFDARCERDMRHVRSALLSPNAICATFHEPPPEAPCRLLQHTKGGLMLPGGMLGGWTFRDATVNLVETSRQKDQLCRAFGSAAPRLGVFAQRLAEEIFVTPTQSVRTDSRVAHGVGPESMHLVYAGRWIANKGLIQVSRAMNLWPVPGARLTIIGDFEDDFPISQSDAIHLTFRDFLRREMLSRSPHLTIHPLPPMTQRQLHDWFCSADAAVYASFHEDEASGNAAHEAVLSGLPAVVTDWCGLGQLGRHTRGGAVRTFATLGGVRYSLAELRDLTVRAAVHRTRDEREAADADTAWVRDAFSPARMRASLRDAIDLLMRLAPEAPPSGPWRCPERTRRLASFAPAGIRRAIHGAGSTPPPGLFVDGGGCGGDPNVSLPHLIQAIQSLYTTWPTPPSVREGCLLRGFWRVALWMEERALVEFGFPGPRVLRFEEAGWMAVLESRSASTCGDLVFRPASDASERALQRAVDLGYLVPDLLHDEMFDRDIESIDWFGASSHVA